MSACVCPIDNKDDSIQKVSALVAGSQGSSYGQFSGPSGGIVNVGNKWGYVGGYTHLSGSTQTSSDLARSLSLPAIPLPAGGISGCAWTLIIVPGIGIPIWIGIGISPIFGSDLSISAPVLSILCIGLWIALFVTIDSKSRAEKQKIYDAQMAEFYKAVVVWNNLYFCHKHDIVFDSTNNQYFARNQVINYCYQMGKRINQ